LLHLGQTVTPSNSRKAPQHSQWSVSDMANSLSYWD
jgi:hypothetical protein